MNTINQTYKFISHINELGVKISLVEKDIKLSFFNDIDQDLIQEIKKRKQEIVSYLLGNKNQHNSIIPRVSYENGYLLSTIQKQIWLASQTTQGSTAHNMPIEVVLDRSISLSDMSEVLLKVIKKHEILRTVFKEDESNEIKQWVLPIESVKPNGNFKDVSDLDIVSQKEFIENYVKKDLSIPFKLEKDILLRFCLFKISQNSTFIYCNMHHLIGDDKSIDVLIKEISSKLDPNHASADDNKLEFHFKDYVVWQNQKISEGKYQPHYTYWKEKFRKKITKLYLPNYKTKIPKSNYCGKTIETYIKPEIHHLFKSYSTKNKSSMFTLSLAIWAILIYKLTNQRDIIIGTPVMNRTIPELLNQIGPYFNILPLRFDIDSGLSFDSFFEEFKNIVIRDLEFQEYPYSNLLENLNKEGSSNIDNLYNIMFSFHNSMTFENDKKIEDFDAFIEKEENSKCDILINFINHEQFFYCNINFNSEIYDVGVIKKLITDYKRISERVLKNKNLFIDKIDLDQQIQQEIRSKNISKLKKL